MRNLFGGAMQMHINAQKYQDVSLFRQVPDHQEVFVESNGGASSIMVELLEMSNRKDVSSYFQDLCVDNESEDSSVLYTNENILSKTRFNTIPDCKAAMIIGIQRNAKFNEKETSNVLIYMAVFRLLQYNTDLLISLNVPTTSTPLDIERLIQKQSECNIPEFEPFQKMIQTLHIIDFDLFVYFCLFFVCWAIVGLGEINMLHVLKAIWKGKSKENILDLYNGVKNGEFALNDEYLLDMLFCTLQVQLSNAADPSLVKLVCETLRLIVVEKKLVKCRLRIQSLMECLPLAEFSSNVKSCARLEIEEMVIAVLDCIAVVCKVGDMGDMDKQRGLYVDYTARLMDLIRNEKNDKKLRTSSVLAFTAFVGKLESMENLKFIFPGAISILIKVLMGDLKLGSKLFIASLQGMKVMMQKVLKDDVWQVRAEEYSYSKMRAMVASDGEEKEDRKSVWLEEATLNLEIGLRQVLPRFEKHERYDVRVMVGELCGMCIMECRYTLENLFLLFVETLLVLQHDEIELVRRGALDAIRQTKEVVDSSEWLRWREKMQDSTMVKVYALARCRITRELQTKSDVCIVKGYLTFLDTYGKVFIESYFTDIVGAFMHVCEFDSIDENVEQIVQINKDQKVHAHLKRYRHMTQKETIQQVENALQYIGSKVSSIFLCQSLINMIVNEFEPELMHVAKILIQGNKTLVDAFNKPLCTMEMVEPILTTLFALPEWTSVEAKSISPSVTSLSAVLILEFVSDVSILASDNVETFLILTLYQIVEKFGSFDPRVENAAYATLVHVAKNANYDSPSLLLGGNIDYLLDQLIFGLQDLDMYPWTPNVLQGILKCTDTSSTPLMEDAVWAIVNSLKMHHNSHHLQILLQAMLCIVSKIDHLIASIDQDSPKQNLVGVSASSPLDILLHDLNNLTEAEPQSEEIIDEKPNPIRAEYIKIINTILITSGYLVAAPEPMVACNALRLSCACLKAVRSDSKDLYPSVHRLWRNLVHCLHRPDKSVIVHALEVLGYIISTCGSFVDARNEEEFWPIVKSIWKLYFANRSVSLTIHEDNSKPIATDWATSGALTAKLKFRLLHVVLLGCQNIHIRESIVPEIAQYCLQFVRKNEPSEILDTVRSIYLELSRTYPGIVFNVFAKFIRLAPPQQTLFASFTMSAYYTESLTTNYDHLDSTMAKSVFYHCFPHFDVV